MKKENEMNKWEVIFKNFIVSLFALFSFALWAAPVEYVGSGIVVGRDGVERCIRVSMILDDTMTEAPGVPPIYANYHEIVGHFPIYTYLVDVEGMGIYAGANGRLDIWLDQTPGSPTFYTEELEVLEDHGIMQFLNGSGASYDWSPWLDGSPSYELAPELVIKRLYITMGYSFELGNEIHLYPVPSSCYCNSPRIMTDLNRHQLIKPRRCRCGK
jgi:hypothetical protein